MLAQQSYGLFVEPLASSSNCVHKPAPGADGDHNTDCYWLELPATPVRLLEREGELAAIGIDEGAPGEVERSIILETVRYERQPYLALLSMPGAGVRVNGAEAPAAAVVRTRDQIELEGAFLLYVSQFSRPYRGPAPDDLPKHDCPVCLTPIAARSLVFICPNCQTALHAQGEETPVEERLECHLSSSTCPCCNQPLTREEGYDYVPSS